MRLLILPFFFPRQNFTYKNNSTYKYKNDVLKYADGMKQRNNPSMVNSYLRKINE